MVKRGVLASLLLASLYAQSPLSELKQEIARYDEIVTKTKENEFYQPFITSVYKGTELEKVGVQTLKEALYLIPGVDIAINNLSVKTPIFRGSNPYAFGQTKLFIDGVLVNEVMADSFSQYLDMPIEVIKRIEVIRGPGSKTEGINAYAGSIYVTTYAEDYDDIDSSRFFLKGGSQQFRSAGFYHNYKKGDFSLYTEFYLNRDDKHVWAGPDVFATGIFGEVNRPLARSGDIPLWLKNYSFAATAKYQAWSLKVRNNYYKHGSAFGVSFAIPQKEDFYRYPSRYAELRYEKDFKNVAVDFKTGVRYDSFESHSHVAPAGLLFPNPFEPGSYAYFPEGFYGILETKQRTEYAQLTFTHEFQGHRIKYGGYFSREKTYDVRTITTDKTGMTTELVDYSQTLPFLDPDAYRNTRIFYISDQFRYDDRLSFYIGLNAEKNTQIEWQVNPRLSAVYIGKNGNIFKLLYSRSHRDPSWQELFLINNSTQVGNIELDPEVVHAFEASYIKKLGVDDYVQLSLFMLRNKNVINNVNEQRKFLNSQTETLYGLEVEWKQMLTNSLKIYANYSYVYGKCGCDEPLPNIAKHMAKMYLLKEVTAYFDLSLTFRYIGDKYRAWYDKREKIDAYNVTDITMELHPNKESEVFVTIKNLFDNDVRYPSPPNTYINDYPTADGRSVIVGYRRVF